MSLLTSRFHNMLQATDIVSISVPFCIDRSDSKGLKWSYKNQERSRVIEMQSAFSFFPPSVHSAVTTLRGVAYQRRAAGGEAAAATCLDRERDCYRNVTHCHLQASQIGRHTHTHTQTHTQRKTRTRKQADEPAVSETNLSNLIRKLIIENKLLLWTCLLFIHSLLRMDKLLFYTEQK